MAARKSLTRTSICPGIERTLTLTMIKLEAQSNLAKSLNIRVRFQIEADPLHLATTATSRGGDRAYATNLTIEMKLA